MMNFSIDVKYRQMMRAYVELARITTDAGQNVTTTDAKDQSEEFFNQCYHLKDFILKDSSGVDFSDVETHITSTPVLSLAADYCNTHKHAGLDRAPRSGKTIDKITSHWVLLEPTATGFRNYTRLEMKVDGQSMDVAALAKQCIVAWNDYFKSKGVLSFIQDV